MWIRGFEYHRRDQPHEGLPWEKSARAAARTMNSRTHVRDSRQPGHFWADNEIIDDYLPAIGVYGFAVYMLLAKYADAKTGQCDPSVGGMAQKLGLSAPTIRKALDTLRDMGLITIRHRRKERDGKLANQTSVYTLLAITKHQTSLPTKPDLVLNETDQGTKSDLPGVLNVVDQGTKPRLVGVLNHVSSNNTHENKNQECVSESIPATAREDTHTQPDEDIDQAFYERLAKIAGVNLNLATRKKREELDETAHALRREQATLEQLERFDAWWHTPDNWRYRLAHEQKRKLGFPRLEWILEEWETALAAPRKTQTTNGRSPPPYTSPTEPRGSPKEMAEAAAKLNPFAKSAKPKAENTT